MVIARLYFGKFDDLDLSNAVTYQVVQYSTHVRRRKRVI
jgi:hypothetical protein